MIGSQLLFIYHAVPGVGLFLLILGILALGLAAGLVFLTWKFRSVAGLKYAAGFLALAAVSQFFLSASPEGVFSQAFASLFSLPWYRPIETFFGESDPENFAFAVKLGTGANTFLIYLIIGIYKRINGRELSLR